MNQMDQIRLKIPENKDERLSEPAMPAENTLRECGVGDSHNIQAIVLARFPDLDALAVLPGHKSPAKPHVSPTSCASGRLVSSSLSLKLLTGLGVILFLMAIVPQLIIQLTDKKPTETEGELQQAWQPPPPAPTADLAPAWKTDTSQAQTSVILKSDISNSSSGLDAESAGSAESSPWPRELGADSNLSPWPNPAHPLLVQSDPNKNGEPPAGGKLSSRNSESMSVTTNRSMALGETQPMNVVNGLDKDSNQRYNNQSAPGADSRQRESYTADRRNITHPGGLVRIRDGAGATASGAAQPGTTNQQSPVQFEGVIETPADRNIYEFSRPGIH
jgi:hypothetical protein